MNSATRSRDVVRFRLTGLLSGGALLVLAVALGAWILARGDGPFALDEAISSGLAAHRAPAPLALATALDALGGGLIGIVVVPVLIACALLAAGRAGQAGVFVLAALSSAALVQVLKGLLGRARPEDILVLADHGSFPSGHTANAVTTVVVLVVLLRRRGVVVAGVLWVVAMALSRLYVGAHWPSDVLGGALLGAGVALVVLALCAPIVLRGGADGGRLPAEGRR